MVVPHVVTSDADAVYTRQAAFAVCVVITVAAKPDRARGHIDYRAAAAVIRWAASARL